MPPRGASLGTWFARLARRRPPLATATSEGMGLVEFAAQDKATVLAWIATVVRFGGRSTPKTERRAAIAGERAGLVRSSEREEGIAQSAKWPSVPTSPLLGEDRDKLLAKPNKCRLLVRTRVPGDEVTQPRNFEGERQHSNRGRAGIDLGGAPRQSGDQIRARNGQHGGAEVGDAQTDAPLLIVFGQHSVDNGAPRAEEC